ncbi:MAG: Lhr family helicase, partial [Pyrinomonadaceae bacterium]
IFPLSRDELVECAALFDCVRRGELDCLSIPEKPLDILAQQIVAAIASSEWTEDELFKMVRSAYPYRRLSREDFDAVVRMLSEGFTTRRGRRSLYLHHDGVNHRLRGRRGARLAAITSGGAIPDTADYTVVLEPTNLIVGTLNEDFAIESMQGDIFQLGNTSWRILRVETSRVRVEDAHGQPPTIPFWLGEAPSRSHELSNAVSRLRSEVGARIKAEGAQEEDEPADKRFGAGVISWLVNDLGIAEVAAEQIVDYLGAAQAALGVIPDQNTLIIERFFDESGSQQLVLHAPFGNRLNRAWGLALRKRFCRKFNFELQAAATEDAIVLSLGPSHSFPLEEVFSYLNSKTVREVLTQAVLDAPMWNIRWRWNAARSLAVLRRRGGQRIPAQLQRMDGEDLLAAVFPDQVACAENLTGQREIPDHPLVAQTLRDCLEEAMDIDGLESLMASIEKGEKKLVARDVLEPSPLAQEILNARPYAFLDDAPLEERRTRAVYSRRWLDPESASDLGALDASAIERVRAEAWPKVENPDELHDALVELGFLTEEEGKRGTISNDQYTDGQYTDGVDTGNSWNQFLSTLVAERRATIFHPRGGGHALWVAAERLPQLEAIFDGARLEPRITAPESIARISFSREDALVEGLRGRLEGIGPITAAQLAKSAGIAITDVDAALLKLEAEGFILRGCFTPGANKMGEMAETQWCARHLLARIHRYTLNRLRQEIEPVSTTDFIRFLLAWQKVVPEHQGEGQRSLAAIVEQLEGFEAPAAAWEGEILPQRMVDYDPGWLDALCLSGEMVWARLSPPKPGPEKLKTSGPIRTTPIALLSRKNLEAWLSLSARPVVAEDFSLSPVVQAVYDFLTQRGASFFADIVGGVKLLRAQVEEGLAELTALGLVTADSFTGLRALLTPSNRRTHAAVKHKRREAIYEMSNAGRWSIIAGRTGFSDRDTREANSNGRENVERICRILLRRYGVVFKRLLEREGLLPPWREMLKAYHRLEARGEIRGGRFVAGISGEQFALPDAVGLLRAIRRAPLEGLEISVSAADPLNLVGIITPGDRLSSHPANRVLYRDGVPIAVLESGQSQFLTELNLAAEWKVKNALLRRSVPPILRSYLGRSA